MSTDWDLYCRTCKSQAGFDNVREPSTVIAAPQIDAVTNVMLNADKVSESLQTTIEKLHAKLYWGGPGWNFINAMFMAGNKLNEQVAQLPIPPKQRLFGAVAPATQPPTRKVRLRKPTKGDE